MLHVYSRCVLIGLFVESAPIVKSITAVAEQLTDFETVRELLETPPTESTGLLAPVSFAKLFYQLQSLLTFSSGAHERSDCLWFEHQQVRNVIERTYLKKGTSSSSSSSSSSGGWAGRSAQPDVARHWRRSCSAAANRVFSSASRSVLLSRMLLVDVVRQQSRS